MEILVLHAKSGKELAKLKGLSSSTSILDVKNEYKKINPSLYVERQSFRLEPRGKSLKDGEKLTDLGLGKGGKLYFKDLGPQLGWTTVFLTEYAGPLVIYLLLYTRPAFLHGEAAPLHGNREDVVKIAMYCWTFHYAKRLLETVFVHRFSHATMPILNIFKNSGYYWGFAAFISYFINHPMYTVPRSDLQINLGLCGFALCELGNLSIHLALRNLRPAGSKERKIPYATWNPFTYLFNFVSCPNYTYEVGAWLSFSVMTQSLPALLFTGAGFYQMAVWALGKHRNYKKEFKDYPRCRKAIIPFFL